MALGRAGADIAIGRDGADLPAYRALPPAGHGRGVLVLPEARGLVGFIRDVCDRLAREGFVALAPDLTRGATAADAAEAERLMRGLEIERAAGDCDRGVAALLDCDAVDGARVGAVGFCMGGQLALLAAARNRRIGAVADFYGVHPGVEIDVSGIQAPVLGIFAERDDFLPSREVDALRARLEAAGRRASFRVEPGAQHGFMDDSRPDVHDAAAAVRGWDALLAFLRAELR